MMKDNWLIILMLVVFVFAVGWKIKTDFNECDEYYERTCSFNEVRYYQKWIKE